MGVWREAVRVGAAALAMIVLGGCGSAARQVAGAPSAPAATAATAGSPVGASATQSAAAPPTTSPQGSSRSPGASGRCLSGAFMVVYPPGDNPVRSACVHLGTTVGVVLQAAGGTTWSALTDSDPAVAAVTDRVGADGTRHDGVVLLRTGTVTFTSVSTYIPDPHGPPSRLWSLTLTVVP